MKKFLASLPFLIIGIFAEAQPPFQRTFLDNSNYWHFAIQKTYDGGFAIAGYTGTYGAGGKDVYLIRTDSLGDTLWTRTYGGAANDYAEAIRQTADSGFILAGVTSSFGNPLTRIYVIRTDKNGDTLWTRWIGNLFGSERANDVVQTYDGGFVITGYAATGSGNAYLIKISSAGNLLWNKSIGKPSWADEGMSLIQDIDSGFVVAGNNYNPALGFNDLFLIKTNSTGDTLWTKSFNNGIGTSGGASIVLCTDSDYAIAGSARDTSGWFDVWLLKVKNNGNLMWSKMYGDTIEEAPYHVLQTSDGGFFLSGYTFDPLGFDQYKGYVIRTSPLGDTLWTRLYGGGGDDGCYWAVQTADSGFALAGNKDNGTGNYNCWLIKTDAGGNTTCSESYINTVVTVPSVIVSATASAVSSASFQGMTATQVNRGGIIADPCSPVSAPEETSFSVMHIFPNPSPGIFNLEISRLNDLKAVHAEIYNSLGAIVFQSEIMNPQSAINLSSNPPGVYFIRVTEGEHVLSGKIIIQK